MYRNVDLNDRKEETDVKGLLCISCRRVFSAALPSSPLARAAALSTPARVRFADVEGVC